MGEVLGFQALKKTLKSGLFRRPIEPEGMPKLLQELAGMVDKAERLGSASDKPEGARYIRLSDTFARYLSKTMRQAAFRHTIDPTLEVEDIEVFSPEESEKPVPKAEKDGKITLTAGQLRAKPDNTTIDEWVVLLLAQSGAPYKGTQERPKLDPDYQYARDINQDGSHTYSWVYGITGSNIF